MFLCLGNKQKWLDRLGEIKEQINPDWIGLRTRNPVHVAELRVDGEDAGDEPIEIGGAVFEKRDRRLAGQCVEAAGIDRERLIDGRLGVGPAVFVQCKIGQQQVRRNEGGVHPERARGQVASRPAVFVRKCPGEPDECRR